MAELYRIENDTLTSIADKIRILSGTEGTMTTAQMDSKLGEANTEVASQTELIEQIMAALNEKFDSSTNLINFTIKHADWGTSNEYQAEEGMTWSEWVNSEYNTGVNGKKMYFYDGGKLAFDDGNSIYILVIFNDDSTYTPIHETDVIDPVIIEDEHCTWYDYDWV